MVLFPFLLVVTLAYFLGRFWVIWAQGLVITVALAVVLLAENARPRKLYLRRDRPRDAARP